MDTNKASNLFSYLWDIIDCSEFILGIYVDIPHVST